MVQRGHGVVQMGGVGSAGRIGGLGLLIGGAGVGNAHHTLLAGVAHKLQATGQLRGNVHQADVAAAHLEQPVKHGNVRVHDVLFGLGPLFLLVEEGSFHVHAPQHSAHALLAKQRAGRVEDAGEDLLAEGHGGAQEAGHALAAQIGGHGADVLFTAVHAVAEVRPLCAVDVNVHKAGGHIAARCIQHIGPIQGARRGDFGNAPSLNFHIGRHKAAKGRENLSVFQNHRTVPVLSPALRRAAFALIILQKRQAASACL